MVAFTLAPTHDQHMFQLKRTQMLRFVSPLLALTTACSSQFLITPIRDLLTKPTEFDGKVVSVRGNVTSVLKLPFVDSRYFTLKDSTGEIIVMTYAELPAMSSNTTVRGVFSTVAIAGAESFGGHLTVGRQQSP